MPLTDTAIRKAKPAEKPYKLFDERGLYLEVTPTGGKWWRLKYRFDGKEKRLSLGAYPDVKLKDARDRRDEARKLLANGIDPSENRKVQKAVKQDRAANSFQVVAREWFAKHTPNWADHHSDRIIRRLERDIFPWIGGSPIADVTAPELLAVVRRIESRGALETAHRALGNCGQVFRYAVATGRAERDPSGDLRGALPPVKGEHFAATTEPKRVAEILRAMDGYEGTLTGRGRFVFPGARSNGRPMSDNAILAAMRRMGIGKDEMSGHGFRAVARTILDEALGVRPDYIEHQLAHAVRDPNGRAYNRTAHLPERRKMMQQWADYLDALASANVVPLRQAG